MSTPPDYEHFLLNMDKTFYRHKGHNIVRGDVDMAQVISNINWLYDRLSQWEATMATYQLLTEKNHPDGYVGLDTEGKIPYCLLPDGESITVHNALDYRDAQDCHPMEAVTGLTAHLDDYHLLLMSCFTEFAKYQPLSQKNVVGGYVGLDQHGKIPKEQLPEDWDAVFTGVVTTDAITVPLDIPVSSDLGGWSEGEVVPEGMTVTQVLYKLFAQEPLP